MRVSLSDIKFSPHRGMLLAILLLGVLLRVVGSEWGLPGRERTYSYYPDERNIMDALGNMQPAEGNFHPGFFDFNPSLYYYAGGAALALGVASGYLKLSYDKRYYYQDHPEQLTKMFRIWRWLTLLFAIGAILNFYWIGRILFPEEKSMGLWSALFLSVIPLQVIFSHFAELTTSALFWISLAWVFILLSMKEPRLKWSVLSGISTGFAIATKYDAILIAGILILAILMTPPINFWKRSIFAATGSVAGFLAGCPYSILDFPKFLNQLEQLFTRIRGDVTGLGCISMPFLHLGFGLGGSLALLAFIGLGWGILQRRKEAYLSGLYVVLYLLLAARSCLNMARYENEILPFLLPWAALPILWMMRRMPNTSFRKLGIAAMGIVLCLPPFLQSAAYDSALLTPDTRDSASAWIRKNIAPGTRVGIGRVPYFYTPPALYENDKHEIKSPYQIQILDCSPDALKNNPPEYLVLSDYEYNPRLHWEPGAEDQERAFMKEALRRYSVIAHFDKSPKIFGSTLPKGFFPGHDMLYPFEEISIFKKNPDNDLVL